MSTLMRKIIHVDMDCFYAAVEIRDNSSLQGKPVAVGGDPGHAGVLTTCNYEARKYGLHSAMSSIMAIRQCPDLILLPVDMATYRAVSKDIYQIFLRYSDVIQRISLDEAYLDVTGSEHCKGSATWIAEDIRRAIFEELKLTASAGIAPNKLLAKIASDLNKPNGQYVVTPEEISSIMQSLPVKKLMGVGSVTNEKMQAMNIRTCGELQALSYAELRDRFGKFGEKLYSYCRGEDDSEVRERDKNKSISVEKTYATHLTSLAACLKELPSLIDRLFIRLERSDQAIAKQHIKIKFDDFSITSVEMLSDSVSESFYESLIKTGFKRADKSVRLLGIGVRFTEDSNQMSLLDLESDT